MLEKDIERRLRELIKKLGGASYKFVSPNNPGVPDRIILAPGGKVWFVELKTETGRLTKLQAAKIAELEKQGANVRVMYGWEAAKSFAEEIMKNGI